MQAVRSVLSHGIAIVFAAVSWCAAEAREFTDSSGKFRVQAEFSSWKGNSVQLKTKDGAVVDVPINRLSNSDQTYVFARIAAILDTRFAASYLELRQQYEDERTGKVRKKKLTQYLPPPKSFRGKMAFICFGGWDFKGEVSVDVRRGGIPEALIRRLSLDRAATDPSEVGTLVIVEERLEHAGSYSELAKAPYQVLGTPTGRTVPAHISHFRVIVIDVARNEVIGAKTFRDKKAADPPRSIEVGRNESQDVVYVGTDRAITDLAQFLNELPAERTAE